MTRDLNIDFHTTADGAPERAHRALDAHARALAPGTAQTLRCGAQARTSPQHRLYWALLGDVALALNESGYRTPSARPVLKDDLHLWAKWEILPVAVQRAEAETGEAEEWETTVYPPGSPAVVTRTTTRLSKPAFSLLVDLLLASDLVAPLGLDEDRTREAVSRLRSGRVDEPDHLRSVPVPAELLADVASAPEPVRPSPDTSAQAHILTI